jgi:hypothetical protein
MKGHESPRHTHQIDKAYGNHPERQGTMPPAPAMPKIQPNVQAPDQLPAPGSQFDKI